MIIIIIILDIWHNTNGADKFWTIYFAFFPLPTLNGIHRLVRLFFLVQFNSQMCVFFLLLVGIGRKVIPFTKNYIEAKIEGVTIVFTSYARDIQKSKRVRRRSLIFFLCFVLFFFWFYFVSHYHVISVFLIAQPSKKKLHQFNFRFN